MAVVKVIMMQKDEGDMLARWIVHYGGLFGYDNLTIMDNGTTDPFTLSLLHDAEKLGVTLYWGYDTQHDFQNKGGHFGNIIGSWDHKGDYDFALPLDCDEIITAFTKDGITTDRQPIMDVLDSWIGEPRALRLDMSLFNVPNRPGWFCPDRAFHKGFLSARSLDILDNGQHEPKSRLAPGHVCLPLTYLHWHNRSFDEVLLKARSKLSDCVDINDQEALQRYVAVPSNPGAHLVRTLTMTPEEYLSKYDGDIQIFVPPGGDAPLLKWGQTPIIWNARQYLELNPDVLADPLGPLHHYLMWGSKEGRPLTPNTNYTDSPFG